MGLLRTIVDAVGRMRKPPPGEFVSWSPALDSSRPYLTQNITFTSLRDLLRAGDNGDAATVLRIFDELEAKDPRVASVAKTRRLALTGLEWDIVSAADQMGDDDAARERADEAAEYCREALSAAAGVDDSLHHLARATGSNLSVVEIVWESNRPVKLNPVAPWRLTSDYQNPGIRIVMPTAPMGVPMPPAKFIVHIPDSRCGFPFDAAIYRTVAHLVLMKQLATADWGTFCQLFGMPVRVATYSGSTSVEEKDAIADMLENMGSSAWAMMREGVEVQFKETASRGTSPHKDLIDYCDRSIAIAFLGGHLAVDTSQATGTYAAGEIQNQVRLDIRDDDVRAEATTLREQLLTPMVRINWPGDDYPVPYFSRIIHETRDRVVEAEVIRKATQELGVPVEVDYVYSTLGIPAPAMVDGKPVNPVVQRFAPNANPFAEEGPL